jgi:SAM-dependent methyltransferase
MGTFKKPSEKEIQRVNRAQRKLFDELYHLFEPPLPEGVPERMEKIVASAHIAPGDMVLDVGSGTGILVSLIRKYAPGAVYACDLSEAMLEKLKSNYPFVETLLSDVRDLALPDCSMDVVFINACYPNIVDKAGAFLNIARMMKRFARMVISHPLGKSFIHHIKEEVPFPLDDFPDKTEAENLLGPFGFSIKEFIDQPELYILVAIK